MLGPALAAALLGPIGIGAPLIAGGVVKIGVRLSLYVLVPLAAHTRGGRGRLLTGA